jgi:single-strand DNA-binding protein
MSLNKIVLSGNLGADAELRYTKSGNPVVSFSLAVNERTQQSDGTWGDYTNWPDCVMFGKRAEALSPWLRKGTKISLTGRIHTRSYQRDGQNVKRWEVRVEDVELMQHKREQQAPTETQAQPTAEPSIYDSDIPF